MASLPNPNDQRKIEDCAKELRKTYSNDGITADVVRETVLIIEFWECVNRSIRALTDKERVELAISMGSQHRFNGFFQGRDPHYEVLESFGSDVLEDVFTDTEKKVLVNSHSPATLVRYREELARMDVIGKTSVGFLSLRDMKDIFAAS